MIDSKVYSLLKVAETGNYTRAAEALSLTQPSISQHIRALESELGIHIFERSKNRLHITREGELALKYAKRMAALEADLRQQLDNERLRLKSLTVGITHTAESNAIVEAFATYGMLSKDGAVNIRVLTDTVPNLYDKLKNYEIDLAVVEGRTTDPELVYHQLDSDYLITAVSPNHPLAGAELITINQLKKEKLILRLPDSSTRKLFESALQSQSMSIDDFDVTLEINNIATIKDLVRADLGVSVLARSTCLDEMKKKKIIALPIENLSMIREINLVHLKDFDHPQEVEGLVRTYSEVRKKFE
jgi:DNA-binding transcriptional LysR family regulator